MSFRVAITEQAEREMQSAFNWWAQHRSKRQADRWYAGLAKAIAALAENPQRHGDSRRGGHCLDDSPRGPTRPIARRYCKLMNWRCSLRNNPECPEFPNCVK